MDNYTTFKSFLDDEGIKYKEDSFESGDRFFVIPQRIKNGVVVNILVVFSKIKIKISVLGVAEIEEEEKRAACYELFNQFNMEYSFFKMYMRPEGNICVEGDFSTEIFDGEFVAKELMNFIMAALLFVDKTFKELMKVQWS